MILVRDLHIPAPRLKKHHLIPAKQRRERDVHLRVRQIHTHAGPRAPTERRQLLLQLRAPGLQPAVGVERLGVGEDGGVVVHVHVVHRDGGVGRDDPVFVFEWGGGGYARHAADDAVGHAETFFDDGAEVGELFEIPPEGDGVGVRDGGRELGFEAAEDARGVEDVEGDDGEGVAGRFVAGHDEQDALVCEAVEALFFGRHFLVVGHFVEDGRDGRGFGIDAGFGIAGFGDLLLDQLLEQFSKIRDLGWGLPT